MEPDPNLEQLRMAALLLSPLLNDLVFVGGCVTGLLVTDPGSGGIRPTRDVDTIVEISSYSQYTDLAERLRELGLKEDVESGVICRWKRGELLIDVMPTDESILGFSNRWYVPAIAAARTVDVGGTSIRLITAPFFVATKLAAFNDRGGGDLQGSHDLEDVMTVIDGRFEIVSEIENSDAEVRQYVATELQQLLLARGFMDSMPGFLLPDPGTQARLPLLLKRLRMLAGTR